MSFALCSRQACDSVPVQNHFAPLPVFSLIHA
jgi:hypothetical protein